MWTAIVLCLVWCIAGYNSESGSNQVNVNASQNIGVINGQVGLPSGTTTNALFTSTTTLPVGRRKRSNQVEVNANQNIAVVNGQVNTGNATNAPSTTTTTTTTTARFPIGGGRRKRSHGRHTTPLPADSSDENEVY
ncbi:hypothetical protein Ddc_15206 [Ditylenchus destructor]|nr:hypothetical protein Ddc_15206 [Ditylenchus destructor]